MTNVKFNTSVVGPGVSYDPGHQYTLSKEDAKQYLDLGYCEVVDEKPEKVKTAAKIKK